MAFQAIGMYRLTAEQIPIGRQRFAAIDLISHHLYTERPIMQKIRMKFVTFAVVALISSIALVFIVSVDGDARTAKVEYTTAGDHVVTLDQAMRFIQNFKNSPTAPSIKGAYFSRDIFDQILAQPGCSGIRYYHAKKDDGTATIVLVGVDGAGNDMTYGVLGETGWPCPPMCGAPNELNR